MMVRVSLILLLMVLSAGGPAAAQSASQTRDYIDRYKPTALLIEKEYGIPAPITLAQAILESASGTSSLTAATNNHFCIKAGASWSGRVYLAWDDEARKSRFRCYADADASFSDYAQLLTTGRSYQPLFRLSKYDYRGWARGLKRAGYATAPNYAQALIGIIDHYRLYLINGGVKLRPGRTVVVTHVEQAEKPTFAPDVVCPDDEQSDEESAVSEVIAHYVVEINDIRCTLMQPGETLAAVARRYDIAPATLLDYNELASESMLHEGSIVFLDKKKKKFTGPQDVYIVKEGETLYDVSQAFGIQLRHLAKLNGLNEYVLLSRGTRIYLK